ncbi:gamma-glutamyltransferase [Undibacterium oligocarboniphilum]|uniref:Glutathione hydrolase proenzyme n=1 Tax=Undibacterium oligocarboniphilum TaxID=666702 RepID=A0A850QE00_9BURK|nr:gamma-glutamyltransferase [Undibacterium oligocarboniphilum]NVO78682.1 gamma-glutamyltransferase [Undibacterium oligocarboniphilum]
MLLKNKHPLLMTVLCVLIFGASSVQAQIAPNIQYDTSYPIISPVHSQHGMVSSEHALASEAGLAMLQRGGNAVDAAVATGFALAVVLPNAGNIGGGGFMLIHDAGSGQDVALDFRESAPALAHRDMYLDAGGNVIPDSSTFSHLAIGIPGTVAGLELALRKYGTLPLKDVMAPAIRYAEQGFEVSPHLAAMLQTEQKHLGQWPSSKAIFFKNGQPLRSGDRLIQKDLAHSLRLIATQGSKAFYEGEIAQKIAAEMQQHHGMISLQDLKDYKAIERQPVRGSYRGYEIISMPPPSSGGVHIIQMLNMLEHYPLREQGVNSAQTLHQMSEVMKLAYADRSEYLGDPAFYQVPVRGLTSKVYADQLIQTINPEHAMPSAAIRPGKPQPYESDQTTHYSVADQKGNVVATTYTLNLNFGSGIVASGTGILLNNEMDDFSVKSGVPNAFGLVGGEANSVRAGKRPLSSMSPTIVLKQGKPFLVTGSPGGSRIITTTLQTILNVVDHGMNVAEAALTPRVHQQWMPDQLRYEKGISIDTLRILEQKGQHLVASPVMGKTQTIQISAEGFDGFSDPRNPDGKAIGY